jgi:hypothetical protein
VAAFVIELSIGTILFGSTIVFVACVVLALKLIIFPFLLTFETPFSRIVRVRGDAVAFTIFIYNLPSLELRVTE